MRRECTLVLLAMTAGLARGQNHVTLPTAVAPAAPPTVFYAGPDVTAPELLPATLPVYNGQPCIQTGATVLVSAVVDAAGVPREIKAIRAGTAEIDKVATDVVAADRFKPGAHNGAPADVAISVEVNMQDCLIPKKGEAPDFKLQSQPEQEIALLAQSPQAYHVGGGISAPVPLNTIEAEYSDVAREKHIEGICVVQMIVDAQGNPQRPRVIRAIGYGLDEKALEAVKEYRFKPAMKNGNVPVPVLIQVEVNFRLYAKPPKHWF